MKPSELFIFVEDRIKAKVNRPVLILSSPGIGKTQICAQVAKKLNIGFKVVHAPTLLPEDYGLPVPSADRTKVNFIVPHSKFPVEGSDCEENGIFLIDEMTQADVNTQKAMANLMQEREVHGHKIKKGWKILATGNRSSDKSGANKLLLHLGNRVSRVSLDLSVPDWTEWALDNGVHESLIAFIQYMPDKLNKFSIDNEVNATPRSWVEGVAAQIGKISKDVEHEAFCGDVGEGPATEFLAFLQVYRDLPDIQDILKAPSKTKVPAELSTIYAVVGMLVGNTSKADFPKLFEYVQRLPPEFVVLYIKQARIKCKEIQTHKVFLNWCANEGRDLLI